MTQASFYIITAKNPQEDLATLSYKVIYRLCKKAMSTGRIAILCFQEDISALSDFLWSQQHTDFLAHSTTDTNSALFITNDLANVAADIIINLTNETLLQTTAGRVLEIIVPDEQVKVAGRERYKAYRQASFKLDYFEISI